MAFDFMRVAFCKGIVCFCILLCGLAVFPAYASHIVGGEVTYKWLGGNVYQVRLDIYQDCLNGQGPVILQDNPAILSLFNSNGVLLDVDSIGASSTLSVPANFSNECINNKPATCLQRQSFFKNYTLTNTTGYYVVYQRCCRNNGILNINDPENTGTTNYVYIPPRGNATTGNNSAVFSNYPPQIICVNNPLVYDHSATDPDGDSLSYEFCTAFRGGTANDSKPIPRSTDFRPVTYINGHTATMPMTGLPPLQVDARTGIITGTPNQQGRFVVAVCCHEWRNGKMVNTVTREFQFVVTNCSKAVVAHIPQFSKETNTYIVQCKGKTVDFKNLSRGANNTPDAYSWDFGVPGLNSDTSHDKEPSYSYPDTGVYLVKLVVNRGSTCADSMTRLVKIFPEFHTGFEVGGLHCPNSPLSFINTTKSTYQPVINYAWSFGDGGSSGDESPAHAYAVGGNYSVMLTAKNVKGCVDTTLQELNIENFRPFAGNDTIIVKGEYVYFRASGGVVYTWSPGTHLNNTNSSNPVGYYPDTTRLDYVVHIASEAGCEGDDTINVWVVNQSAIFVPSAFSPNGDGRNDVLRPIGIGYSKVNFFRVFNRWGQGVFYGTHFNEGWDGSFQAHTADVGTYYWVLSVTDRFGQEMQLQGDATLVR
jgi:gliding motility-associated-like protein